MSGLFLVQVHLVGTEAVEFGKHPVDLPKSFVPCFRQDVINVGGGDKADGSEK